MIKSESIQKTDYADYTGAQVHAMIVEAETEIELLKKALHEALSKYLDSEGTRSAEQWVNGVVERFQLPPVDELPAENFSSMLDVNVCPECKDPIGHRSTCSKQYEDDEEF